MSVSGGKQSKSQPATAPHSAWVQCALGLAVILGCTSRLDKLDKSTPLHPGGAGAAVAPSPTEQTAPRQGPIAARGPASEAPLSSQRNARDSGAQHAELFRDVTELAGIQFRYSNGRSAGEFAIIESLGGGAGVIDFDSDGNLDLLFAGGGSLDSKKVSSRPCGLFRNLGAWGFRDATAHAQASANAYFTHGVYPGDIDGDGFDDLAISGYGGVQLLLNMGDGTFETLRSLVTNSTNAWSSSLAWADLDNNGHLDLYVAHYVDWSWEKHPVCPGQGDVEREVCAPREFAGNTDAVYMNDGEFPLRREAESIGLVPAGKGLGVAVGDLNADSFVDIYVANDTTDNYLYLNDGTGKFTENAVLAGVSGDDAGVSTGSMGVSIFDATGDQLPDIFVANFERELSALYCNEGEGYFAYMSRQAGFAAYEAGFVGFGTVPIDFDFDGDLDLIVANGHVSYRSPHAPYRQLPLVFENQSKGRFQRLTTTGYLAAPHTGRGLAMGDLDNDGAVDLVCSNLEDPVAVLQSRKPLNHQWYAVRLVGTRSNRAAVGAVVSTERRGARETRFLCGGGSYLSHSDRSMVFYADAQSDTPMADLAIEVLWPSAVRETFSIQPNRETVVREGAGQTPSMPARDRP